MKIFKLRLDGMGGLVCLSSSKEEALELFRARVPAFDSISTEMVELEIDKKGIIAEWFYH